MEMKHSPLFKNIKEEEITSILKCLLAKKETYLKNEFIFHAGNHIDVIGLVLSGSVYIIKEDFWGNRSILSEAGPNELFGESFAISGTDALDISVIAAKDTQVLFLDIKKVTTLCSSACQFHSRLVQNLLLILSAKNRMLTRKMEHITKRSTREKLLSYLSDQALKSNCSNFEIPFNRSQLAEYLSVDRSAMSNELSKMRNEGILEFKKNNFLLRQYEKDEF